MRPLIIDDTVRAAVHKLIKHAEENPFTVDDLLDIKNGQQPPAGDREGFCCIIPFDYRVVYSIEMQPQGKAQHMSISVPVAGKYPSPWAVSMIGDLLGFADLEKCHVWIDEADVINVVNVIQYI